MKQLKMANFSFSMLFFYEKVSWILLLLTIFDYLGTPIFVSSLDNLVKYEKKLTSIFDLWPKSYVDLNPQPVIHSVFSL